MATAANPANVVRAPDILAMRPDARPAAGTGPDPEPDAVWDNEGGHLVEARVRRPAVSQRAVVPS